MENNEIITNETVETVATEVVETAKKSGRYNWGSDMTKGVGIGLGLSVIGYAVYRGIKVGIRKANQWWQTKKAEKASEEAASPVTEEDGEKVLQDPAPAIDEDKE